MVQHLTFVVRPTELTLKLLESGDTAKSLRFLQNTWKNNRITNHFEATVDEQEKIILDLSAGNLTRKTFTNWLKNRVVHITTGGECMKWIRRWPQYHLPELPRLNIKKKAPVKCSANLNGVNTYGVNRAGADKKRDWKFVRQDSCSVCENLCLPNEMFTQCNAFSFLLLQGLFFFYFIGVICG